MNRYLKLVNFELNRFRKIYVTLILLTLLSQIAAVLLLTKGYLNDAYETIKLENLTEKSYVLEYGGFDFTHITGSLLFLGPIALSAGALIFYIFLIWYRDWFGKNTFAYRLLMLPTSRVFVYLSKATAIFLMVLGLVAIQLMILPLENTIYEWMIPKTFLNYSMTIDSIINSNPLLRIIIPGTFSGFLINYGIGLMIMFILFAIILFERSYRIKGIIMGILYAAAVTAVFVTPLMAMGFEVIYLYPGELFGVLLILSILITGLTLWVSRWLIIKKITV
ncbi:hypothetical protein I6J18_03275 [Peribacillus psychrosaccharolyticus]|uniref:ABC-2 family transporter protein n=1 Tax=Peribacillus psychrosaccharolyticus TaxID=1407 RepID=A0A974NNJ8_PERPY|nr:hypothetical protein [Peribacillus psychrosaccharolyticus]MEC2055823.1 hypothetical protein [Peribacillus psychrosaccharolyticus]MED3742998.1 hypothetical protein [Peribacillus psychrosaccharolyticus]QQT00944.1 hypothetical protein I6J18_03275 [Peribacillus psychrosaccharolyticus]